MASGAVDLTSSRSTRDGAPAITELIYSFQTGGSERIGVEIARFFHSQGRDVSVCATHGDAGPASDLLDQAGIPWTAADRGGGSRLSRATKLFNHFRSTRCEVLHVHHFNMLAAAYVPARLAGVRRIVVTEHSDYMMRQDPSTMRRARTFGKKADAISVVHEGLRRFICENLGVGESEVEVIPNGVDTELYSPGPRPEIELPDASLEREPVRLCIVGRLHPDKDHLNLLQAVARMRDRGAADFVLYVVGDGSERQSIEAFVSEHSLREIVVLLGDRSDVGELLRGMDIFVLSSRTEGLPVALLEAMSTGLPSVVTDVGGVADAVSGGAGLVVPRKDPNALAVALISLVESRDRRTRSGTIARRSAVTKFTRSTMFNSYERLLLAPG